MLGLSLLVATFWDARFSLLFERRGEVFDRLVRVDHYAVAEKPRVAVYRKVARWLNEHGTGDESPVVLANEVGIMGYSAPDHTFRDAVGLATPGVNTEQMKNMSWAARRYDPTFIIAVVRGRPVSEIQRSFRIAGDRKGDRTVYIRVATYGLDRKFGAGIYLQMSR